MPGSNLKGRPGRGHARSGARACGFCPSRPRINEQRSTIPGRRLLLAFIKLDQNGRAALARFAKGRQQQGANGLVEDETVGKAQLLGDFRRATCLVHNFSAQPVGRAQEFAGEDIRLHLLALARRIALYHTRAAVDRVPAKLRLDVSYLVARIVMEFRVTDLVSDHDHLVLRVLATDNVHEPIRTFERPVHANSEHFTGLAITQFQIGIFQDGIDESTTAAVTLGDTQRF